MTLVFSKAQSYKMTIDQIKQKILPVLQSYGVIKAGIFGSFARGEADEGSEVDILVEISDQLSLLDFVGLKLELEDVLGRKVDLGEYSTIKPVIREQVLKDTVRVI